MKKSIIIIGCILLLADCGTQDTLEDKNNLFLVRPTGHAVFYGKTSEFAKDSSYTVILQFNNPIVRIDQKEIVNFTMDDSLPTFRKNIFFDNPFSDTAKDGTHLLANYANSITLHYWDSTHVTDDANNPGAIVTLPELKQTALTKYNNSGELTIPPGTFTDAFGNKSKLIHIYYKKKKK